MAKPQIDTIESLQSHLQTALEIEFSTIPTYLYALYSIKGNRNDHVKEIIRSVVMEEMLHISLVSNVFNAVGGKPNLVDNVPLYPGYLPGSAREFEVNLEKFSEAAIDTFLKIEKPEKKDAPPEADHYHTIGQFYHAVKDGLIYLCKTLGEDKVFTGDPSHQISHNLYYGGGGELLSIPLHNRVKKFEAVRNLETALKSLEIIVDQGEGLPGEIWDGDHLFFAQMEEVAHYFRFNEIKNERMYAPNDTPKCPPSGAPLEVFWEDVYPVVENPKPGLYSAYPEIQQKSDEFDEAYFKLLDCIQEAFNGKPHLLIDAVGGMFQLKYKAQALMKIPLPGTSYNCGPLFRTKPRSQVSHRGHTSGQHQHHRSHKMGANNVLPPVSEGFEVFYYGTQTCLWSFFEVDKSKLEAHLGPKLDKLKFNLATFEDPNKGYVVVKPMAFSAEYGSQSVTSPGSPVIPGGSFSTEVEFCVLVNPKSRQQDVGNTTFKDYVLGWDQQKVIGQLRLDVLCDNEVAVSAGRANFGEHKFLGSFTYEYPCPNKNPSSGTPFDMKIEAFTWENAGVKDSMMFQFQTSLEGLNPTPSNFGPEVLYAAQPPEEEKGKAWRAIGERRSYDNIFTAYFCDHGRYEISFGPADGAKELKPVPPFGNGKPIPGSQHWPRDMVHQMKEFLNGASLKAHLLFESRPAEFEPRPFYVNVD